MKTKELRALLQAAADKQFSRMINLSGSDNPQTVEQLTKSKATHETLQAVIEALDAPRPAAAYDLNMLTR